MRLPFRTHIMQYLEKAHSLKKKEKHILTGYIFLFAVNIILFALSMFVLLFFFTKLF